MNSLNKCAAAILVDREDDIVHECQEDINEFAAHVLSSCVHNCGTF